MRFGKGRGGRGASATMIGYRLAQARPPEARTRREEAGMRTKLWLAVAAALASTAAVAQQYPTRPVRVIVPFPPGGPTDAVARVLAQQFAERLGQPFVVDNRPGAGGNVGMAVAARAAGDGHTLLVASSTVVVNPGLYAKLPFDPYKDFVPVTIAAYTPNVFIAHPSLPARSLQELVAYAKANPGKLDYGSSGSGTTGHLAAELLKLTAGIAMQHVPFAGGGPMTTAVVGGQVPLGCGASASFAGLIRGGQLRGLAVTTAKRSAAIPDLPTVVEAGFPQLVSDTMSAVLLPAGTPATIVDRLYRETARIMAAPEIRERLLAIGVEPLANTPAEFAEYLRVEIPKWTKVIRQAGIKVE